MSQLVHELYRELAPGGYVLVLLLIISMFGWGRALWWSFMVSGCNQKDLSRVRSWLQQSASKPGSGGESETGESTTNSGLLPPILFGLLQNSRYGDGVTDGELRESLSTTVHTLTVQYRSGVYFVGVCASVLPLLGLFGTLLGIIQAFDVLSLFGSGEIQRLSHGISQALITTQAGLLLALPMLFFYRYMKSSVKTFSKNLELLSHEIVRNRGEFGELVPAAQKLEFH